MKIQYALGFACLLTFVLSTTARADFDLTGIDQQVFARAAVFSDFTSSDLSLDQHSATAGLTPTQLFTSASTSAVLPFTGGVTASEGADARTQYSVTGNVLRLSGEVSLSMTSLDNFGVPGYDYDGGDSSEITATFTAPATTEYDLNFPYPGMSDTPGETLITITLSDSSNNVLYKQTIDPFVFPTSPDILNQSAFILGPGSYSLDITATTNGEADDFDNSLVDYSATLTAVPEPTTALLLPMSAVLALRRRHNRPAL